MASYKSYETNVQPKLKEIEAWCRDGLDMKQISKKLDINISTLYKYKNNYRELEEALKRGREVADIEVENSLYKRAMGFNIHEVRKEVDSDGKVKTVVTTKEVVPDTTAIIFWLKNRKPAVWRDRKQIENTGTMDINTKHDFSSLSKEEIRELLKEE